jgi:HPt (histidine-containing phosphotransfer) domain-containing protein
LSLNDAEQIRNAAHSIKGASSSLGIDGLTELVKEIEEESKGGGLAKARESLDTLSKMLDEINSL